MSSPRLTSGNRDVGIVVRGLANLAGRASGTEDPKLFLALGRAGRLFWGWLAFAAGLMPFGSLPRRDTELIILRVAVLTDSEYERTHHKRLARLAGLSAAEIAATADGPAEQIWTSRQRVLLNAVDELHAHGDLNDQVWAQLLAELGERRAVEFLLLVGHYQMLATTFRVLRITPDQPRGTTPKSAH